MHSGIDPYKALLSEIVSEWNRAEQEIKRAEQLAGKAVTPAINELRYGGRRVIDALQGIANGDDPQKIQDLLRDACFDCHRARHDAIDASISTIILTLK